MMIFSLIVFLFSKLSSTQRADGQYWPCNPLTNATGACLPNRGLATSTYSIDFAQQTTIPEDWTISNYATINFGPLGAEFTFAKRYDAPQLWTDFYIFFGTVKVVMQVANGTGIISSSVLISDDFDEIDFEFSGNNFGQAGSAGLGQNNYFGKGITGSYDRGSYFSVASPQYSFHTYEVDWTPQSLTWSVDGTVVRTLSISQTDSGTHQYPQTPSKLQLGLWDGGDPNQNSGTRAWAGGLTNFSLAPYTMYVKSVEIVNMYPAAAYNYTDRSGRWQSIQLLQSESSSSNGTQVQPSTPVTHSASSTSSVTTTSSIAPLSSSSSTASSSSLSSFSSSSSITSHGPLPSPPSSSLSFSSIVTSATSHSSTATSTRSSSNATTETSPSRARTSAFNYSTTTTKASMTTPRTENSSLTNSIPSSSMHLIPSGMTTSNSGAATNSTMTSQKGISSTLPTLSSGCSSEGMYPTSSSVWPAHSNISAFSQPSDKISPATIQPNSTSTVNPSSSGSCSRRQPLISTWTTPSSSPSSQLTSLTTTCTRPKQSSSNGPISSGMGSDWTRWGIRHGRIPLFHAPGA